MGIIAGIGTKLAVAKQSTWGSKATSFTTLLSFTSETLKLIKEKKEEDALIGAATIGRLDSLGLKAQGDINFIVKPSEVGIILKATLGSESIEVVEAGSVYLHHFTPILPGVSNSLPKMTIAVDRITATSVYEGAKVNQLTISCKAQDYLRATLSLICRDEVSSTVTSWPTRTSLKAFKFLNGQVKVDGSILYEVTGADIVINNNLEDNLYTMDGSLQMAEIECQKRDITAKLECLRSSTTESIRTNTFLQDEPCNVLLVFQSDDEVTSGYPYKLEIEFPNAYLTEDPSNAVAGAERLRMTFNFKASEQNGEEAVVVRLQDDASTEY